MKIYCREGIFEHCFLVLSPLTFQICYCEQNEGEMKKENLMKKYELFGRLMIEERIYNVAGMDYRRICSIVGVRPGALDKILMKELGMKGEELVDIYREGDGKHS